MSVGPLFIPLKREFFEAFERGEKRVELRPYGPRWNERTCRIGRGVVLSLGYGKQRWLYGRVIGFRESRAVCCTSEWLRCYAGRAIEVAACIEIELEARA